MKPKICNKKLILNKKTISHLSNRNMLHVNGGVPPITSICDTAPIPDATCATAETNCQVTCVCTGTCNCTNTCDCTDFLDNCTMTCNQKCTDLHIAAPDIYYDPIVNTV